MSDTNETIARLEEAVRDLTRAIKRLEHRPVATRSPYDASVSLWKLRERERQGQGRVERW